MSPDSILSQSHIESLMATAKRNLERDGRLDPVLFLQIAGEGRVAVPLDLPGNSAGKQAYFARLGLLLRRNSLAVEEAVFLAESWYVEAGEEPDLMATMPSQHPRRQEAIVFVGRDAEGTRVSSLVQPFRRGEHDEPLWSEPAVAVYDEPATGSFRFVGLLDRLFDSPAEHDPGDVPEAGGGGRQAAAN